VSLVSSHLISLPRTVCLRKRSLRSLHVADGSRSSAFSIGKRTSSSPISILLSCRSTKTDESYGIHLRVSLKERWPALRAFIFRKSGCGKVDICSYLPHLRNVGTARVPGKRWATVVVSRTKKEEGRYGGPKTRVVGPDRAT